MSKMSREEKLFRKESMVLDHYRKMIGAQTSPEETRAGLIDLTRKYKNLLEQTRFLTWISGRLERKLQRTNRELHKKNEDLRNTLDDLSKAQASRSAYAIIYSIAIALFVLEEFFVEPVIGMFGDSISYSILIKLFIVLLLKIAETIIEHKVTRNRKNVVLTTVK
jgi:chromosome segregation ATPase